VATLRCPHCGARQVADVPRDACQWAYDCLACRRRVTARSGDCCVFCSYGDERCAYAT